MGAMSDVRLAVRIMQRGQIATAKRPVAAQERCRLRKKMLCFRLWMKAFGIAPALLAEVAF
jgi:hypothetical protein